MNTDLRPVVTIASFVVVAAAGFFSIGFYWKVTNNELESINQALMIHSAIARKETVPYVRVKTPKQTVKAIYLTAYSAGSPKKIDEMIKLIDRTELNAVIIDIKDYSGLVLYDSKVPLVVKHKLKDNRYPNLEATIKKLHDHNIYVIARQTVMQDPVLAQAKTEWALKDTRGGNWRDHKGLMWVDPTKKDVWQYNVAIAKEAAEYGFDEINFDYVRFPSDGNMSRVVYSDSRKKYEVMGDFYAYLGKQMADVPVWTSLDMFGFVMEKSGEDDMNIGQRLADAVGVTDYIYPMMYPSHYPSGHLNLKNPAEHPGAIFDNGMAKGMPFFKDVRAEVRPWIQAFNLGAVYDGAKIRAQIDSIEKYSSSGWLLWNASNRYSDAGLKLELSS